MTRFPGFVGPSYVSQSVLASAQRCVNWYPQPIEVPYAKNAFALYPTPGFSSFATASEAPFRAQLEHDGRVFGITGAAFYEYFSDGTKTSRGTVEIDANPAFMVTSGDIGAEILIAAGSKGYLFDLTTNTLTTVLASGANFIGFLDGYFLSLNTATSTFRISDLADGTTWDPTQFAQRSLAGDPWIAMLVIDGEIWLFGTKTTEVWYNADTFPFPFAPRLDAVFAEGILAPYSVADAGAPIWLARNAQGAGHVVMAGGYSPRRVSNEAIEYAISRYTTVTDAEGLAYQDQGHTFYALTFPAENATWTLDLQTGLWHERGFFDSDTGNYLAWRPRTYSYAFGKHLVGDRLSGTLYQMDLGLFSDVDGEEIVRMRRAPHLYAGGNRITYDRFQLDMEVGVGLQSGQGSDPKVMLRISRDGGQTWGNERMASAGAVGKYKTRVFWTRMGDARDAVFEIRVSDPIPWRIVEAYLDYRVGLS